MRVEFKFTPANIKMQKNLKPPFIWDYFSDQPYPIKDKKYKRVKRWISIKDIIPLVITNIIIFPLSILIMRLFKDNQVIEYGVGVNLDKGDKQIELVEELNIKHLIIRVPLWDINRLDEYISFSKSFGDDKEILINIMQDRENIENHNLLRENIIKIFNGFKKISNEFQIGTAINRTKWGFFSVKEYLDFYKTVQDIRDKDFSNIKLIGSSVIDFEYYYTVRSLFNLYPIKYDRLSSLLYVDRRGSPKNSQMGIFDTKNKISMLYALMRLSNKAENQIYITEVNWPIRNTAPYAPTSELECVSEDLYNDYILEYLNIAKESQKVKRVYIHQLIARGYGLVDDSNNQIRKMKAFYSLKDILKK